MSRAIHVLVEIGIRIAMWMLIMWINYQSPLIRHIDEDELWMYRYPSVDSYVPKKVLNVILLVVPSVIFLVQYLLNRKDETTVSYILNAAAGVTLTYCVVGLFVELLKIVVGRPRPNFFYRCFPDGYGTDIDSCSGEYKGVMDGRKSFPSGHSALSFGCMIYMMLYLRQTINLQRQRFCRGVIVSILWALPLAASLIAASRLADYHHHSSDVIGGALLGSTVAYLTHRFYEDTYSLEEYQGVIKELKHE